MTRWYAQMALALAAAGAACSGAEPAPWSLDPLARPQATSLLGEPLYALPDTVGSVAEADAALEAAPDDVERLIAAGRVRRTVWQYRQAIALYSRAMELAPNDWRPYRFRGHRYISVREFEPAIADLEAARDRAPLNWDVAYHLGLAYFVAGRFDAAADEYLRCLDLGDDAAARAAQSDAFRSCSENGDDPESRVAMTDWAVRALRRAGRDAQVAELLAAIPADLPVEENVAYYHDLLFYKGVMPADALLSPGDDAPYRLETVGFGVANWLLADGDTSRAVGILRRVADDPWWPGFGRIAAEADLARLPR